MAEIKTEDLLFVSLKIIGLWFLAMACKCLLGIIFQIHYFLTEDSYITQGKGWIFIISVLLPFLTHLAFGLLFILGTTRIAAVLSRTSKRIILNVADHIKAIQVGVILLGVYFFVESLARLIILIYEHHIRQDYFEASVNMSNLISSISIMAVSCVLIFGSNLVVYLAHTAERAKEVLQKTEKEEESRLTHKCPHCSFRYCPSDYRTDIDAIYCRNCKKELPKA